MNRVDSLRLSGLAVVALASLSTAQTYNFAEYWPVAPGYSWKAVDPGCAQTCTCTALDFWQVLGPDSHGPNAYRVGPGTSFSYVLEDTTPGFIFHGYYFGTTYTPISPSGSQDMGAIPDGFSFVVDSGTEFMFRDWDAITSPDKALYPIDPNLVGVGVWIWYDVALPGTSNNHNAVFESGLPAGPAPPNGSVTDVEFFVKGQGMHSYMNVHPGPTNPGTPWPPVLTNLWAASIDCNGNGIADHLDISSGTSQDLDMDCIPDECVPGNAYCFGDGSGAACPCSAFGGSGEGCANTTGSGATLVGTGNPSIANDNFQLGVAGVPGAKPGLLLRGNSQVAIPAGDGILCTSGGSQRSQVQVTVAGTTAFTDFNGSPFGHVANVGAPTNFQFWYRDPGNPCSGSGFNFTNAWSVTFVP